MSAEPEAHDPHAGPIKTPRQLAATVAAAFIVPTVTIILLVNFVVSGNMPAAGSAGLSEQAIAERLRPVGQIAIGGAPGAAAAPRTGEQVYQTVCSACHATGLAGAPKAGDAAAWAPRLAQGMEVLLNSALKGKGGMPAQGGGATSEYEIARALVYLGNQAGGKLSEPPAPQAAASAAN